MNILFFGPSGVRKSQAGKAFLNVCASQMPGCKTQYLDVKNFLKGSTHNLIKYPHRLQQDEVASAISLMARELVKADLNVIGLHAVHFCSGIPVFPCVPANVRELSPDAVVTLIDDTYVCRQRLTDVGYPYTHHELLVWRAIECGFADNLAEACGTRNILIAAKHPSITLYRILFQPKVPRLYSGSQITRVRNVPEAHEEIDTHRRRIHQQFAVYDPLTIDDRLLINHLTAEDTDDDAENTDGHVENTDDEMISIELDSRWVCDLLGLGSEYLAMVPDNGNVFPVQISGSEARALSRPIERSSWRNIIDAHITARDFRYIDQSDVMVAYRPRYNGHESRGVAAEKSHAAFGAGIPVVEYTPPSDEAESRPFSTIVPGPVLSDLELFYESITDVAQQEVERRLNRDADHIEKFEGFRATFSST